MRSVAPPWAHRTQATATYPLGFLLPVQTPHIDALQHGRVCYTRRRRSGRGIRLSVTCHRNADFSYLMLPSIQSTIRGVPFEDD